MRLSKPENRIFLLNFIIFHFMTFYSKLLDTDYFSIFFSVIVLVFYMACCPTLVLYSVLVLHPTTSSLPLAIVVYLFSLIKISDQIIITFKRNKPEKENYVLLFSISFSLVSNALN